MTDLLKKKESIAEKIWINAFRVGGVAMFFIAVYLPAKSMLLESAEEVTMTKTRWIFLIVGFFLVWGAKNFGVVTNGIGAAITNFLNKFTK